MIPKKSAREQEDRGDEVAKMEATREAGKYVSESFFLESIAIRGIRLSTFGIAWTISTCPVVRYLHMFRHFSAISDLVR